MDFSSSAHIRPLPNAILNFFQTARVVKMRPNGAPKASHEPWFESSCSFWTPRGATMTLKRGCGTHYSLIFDDIHESFVRFYVTFGMPLCCLELKVSYLRTCNSPSMIRLAGMNFTYDHISFTHNKWSFNVQQYISFIKKQKHNEAR